MNFSDNLLKREEKALYQLRELYEQYGYSRYKVSKFEEYDLYAHNKSFLISENILTFTDTNGKLMALKPDVTLSIIKNVDGSAAATHKLYYNETVYRTSSDSNGFQEIMQTGLECIGKLDTCAICEVLMLAQKSLSLISKDYVLDISHMGFLTGLLENAGIEAQDTPKLLACVETKNLSEICSYCEKNNVSRESADAICELTMLYEPLAIALPKLKKLAVGEKMIGAYDELCEIGKVLSSFGDAKRLYLDFSMVNDMNYYNGIVFRGFLNGIPDGVLSGGRYDSLLHKMGKSADAIGFAVYLNALSRFERTAEPFDTDVLLVYDPQTNAETVTRIADKLRADGRRVLIQNEVGSDIRYKELLCIDKNGAEVKS